MLRLCRRSRAPGHIRPLCRVNITGHFVGHFGDHAQIVRDEQDRHAAFVAQLAQQVENLGLDRHVERRRRLVGDQQLRIAGQRHRDHHPLPLPAGQLVRIRIDPLLGFGNADFAQQLRSPASRASALVDLLMQHDRLHDLRADREHRVERRHRLLKDHADVAAANRLASAAPAGSTRSRP